MRIKGIGGDAISEGFVYLKLSSNGQELHHKFYVFKNLPCRSDGILGQDFISKYNCILNFEKNMLTLNNKGSFSIPLQMGQLGHNNYITLQPRCESIHFIDLDIDQECVIAPSELCEGVFLASILVSPNKGRVPVKILNTRDEKIRLSYFTPELLNLQEYSICSFEKESVNADRVKKLFSILKLNYLNSEEQKSIENICAKYSDVFFMPGDKLGVTNLYQQKIHLKENVTPSYVKPYRLPKSQKQEIDRQIQQMLNDDVIEESQSEWCSPLLLVPKKSESSDKKWRVVIDYRKLNERIKDDKFPLPNIAEILDSLSGAVYFTHLDLTQSYYQLLLEPESRKYTAFTTDKQYQLKRLPMGLKISPSAFSRLMTVAMAGLNYEKALIYLDDLICFGRNLEIHNKNLIAIFERLRKVNLKVNPSKCQFLKKELLYLGHVVSSKGVQPDPEKTKVIQNYPRPQSSDEVKRFVAFANYYRRFVSNFAEITIPLNKLCRKGAKFEWTSECQNSFMHLKEKLCNPPILQYPDFSAESEFILRTDASGKAIGAVLCNTNNLPVAYGSRTLNKSEVNYPTIEKELLAIVWAVRYFRPYLFGKSFTILTDHKPLVYLFSMSNPSSRLLKFRLTMEEYNYKIEYVRGTSNVAADALSRIVISSDELKELSIQAVNVMTRSMTRKLNEDKNDNFLVDKVSTDERTDHPTVVEMLKKPKNCIELTVKNGLKGNFVYFKKECIIGLNPNSRSCQARDAFVREFGLFCKKNNITEVYVIKNNETLRYVKWLTNMKKKWAGPRICVVRGVKKICNNDDKLVILNDFHLLPTSGHAGMRRMISNIKKYYFWSNMEEDVKRYVKKCVKCQTQKHSLPTKQPMEITTTAQSAFDKIFLDIVGPLSRDYYNYSYILTIQCELSKYLEAYPLENKDSISVAKAFVDNFILRFGIPREIATDRGTEFLSTTMREVCKLLHINQISSTAYHHQSIGALENSHKSLNAYLRIQTDNNPRYWSTWLQYFCFSYNTAVHTETKYTPFELVFGKKCNIPSNLNSGIVEPLYNDNDYVKQLKYRLQVAHNDAKCNLINNKMKRKIVYDKYTKPVSYKCGDKLLVKSEKDNKFEPVYLGPFVVIEDLNCNVRIERNGKAEIIHKNRTKPYFAT